METDQMLSDKANSIGAYRSSASLGLDIAE
jgi:hypothetical protein